MAPSSGNRIATNVLQCIRRIESIPPLRSSRVLTDLRFCCAANVVTASVAREAIGVGQSFKSRAA